MAESIRCPHCGKAYVLKPELAGKQVRCRQCQKPFTVTAPTPPDDAEEPIVLTLATPEPPTPTAPSPRFSQDLVSGPALAPPGQEETLAVGTVLPLTGQAVLGPVIGRRRPKTGNPWWRQWLERLLERKLTAAVAIASLLLLFLFLLLFFAAGLPVYFVVPSLAGFALTAVGTLLPVPKRPKRSGTWIGPAAARLAISTGVFGLVFAILFVIMVFAAQSGHPIPRAIGLSDDYAVILVICVIGISGGCFVACFLTLLLSGGWAVARQYGLLRIANFLFLAASPVLLLILCLSGIVCRWTRGGAPIAYRPPSQMNRDTGMTPGWPQPQDQGRPDPRWPRADPTWPGADRMQPGVRPMPAGPSPPMRTGPIYLPPAMRNPNDPQFYRTILAELRSSDLNRRRMAVFMLTHVEPKELRDEISKALEPLASDSDDTLRSQSLEALDVWSTGDIVPIAIRGLKDSSIMVRHTAIEVLGHRKDPRAIEPLVELLSDQMGSSAAECLQHLGPKVEDAVLARYDNGNDDAKRLIIEILGAVATEKGIAKLRQIAADRSNFFLSSEAKNSLRRRGVSVD
jgi:hypothetical protein